MGDMKIAFYASKKPKAQKSLEEMTSRYGKRDLSDADVIVVLGGDGTMLHALHNLEDTAIPLYGMNCGTLGFLLNSYSLDDLPARLDKATRRVIHPLRMKANDKSGAEHQEVAYNEVSMLRETHNTAKLKININGKTRMNELVCDGLLLSTPMGSTAYNLSAGGPIIPLDAGVLPLTPISPFRPRRWPGALLHHDTEIEIEVLKALERPVSVTADSNEIRNIKHVKIRESRSISRTLLFDDDHGLEERIFEEQFSH